MTHVEPAMPRYPGARHSLRDRQLRDRQLRDGELPGGLRPGSFSPGEADGIAGLRPWAVVATWAVLLGLLVAVSARFGNIAVVLEISGGAAALVLVLAGSVWLAQRFRPRRAMLGVPSLLGVVFLFALTMTVAWLALAFGAFMLMIAAVPFVAAIHLEIAVRRQAASANARS